MKIDREFLMHGWFILALFIALRAVLFLPAFSGRFQWFADFADFMAGLQTGMLMFAYWRRRHGI